MEIISGLIIFVIAVIIVAVVYESTITTSIVKHGFYNHRKIKLIPEGYPAKMTKDRAIQLLFSIADKYPDINIDETIKIWIEKGFIIEEEKNDIRTT